MAVNSRRLVVALGGFTAVIGGYALDSRSVMILGLITAALALLGAMTRDLGGAAGAAGAALFWGAVAAALLGLGIYAVAEVDPLFSGIVLLVALALPAAVFLFVAWALITIAVKGRRSPGADRIGSWLAAANRPLRDRHDRKRGS